MFPLHRPARLAVFASGRGSNLRALAAAFAPGDPTAPIATVALVLSDQRGAGALAIAAALGLPHRFVPFGRDRAGFELEAAQLLLEHRIDLVCLAGFMRLLSPDFVSRFAGRLLNIHPSLLPAFPGLNAVEQALAAGVTTTGCTVHFVDAGVDTGPILVQRRVPVLPGDDAARLSARIGEQEHTAYPEAVRRVLAGAVAR